MYKSFDEKYYEGDIVIVLFAPEKYNESLKTALDFLKKSNRKICYVSLNKPFTNIEGYGKGNLMIIDCVTASVKKPQSHENVEFVSSPKALTEMSIAIKKAIEKGYDFLFFDSVSTLLLYNDKFTTLKFIHSIISMLRTMNCKGMFVILEDSDNDFIKDLSMFADNIRRFE